MLSSEEYQITRERVISCEESIEGDRVMCIVCKERFIEVHELRMGSLSLGMCKHCLGQVAIVIIRKFIDLMLYG